MYQEIINKVAAELNIPKEVVKLAYNSYWEFIKKTIQKLPLQNGITDEEFLKLKTNFNIPYLGKLYCDFDCFKRGQKRINYRNTILNNDKDKKD